MLTALLVVFGFAATVGIAGVAGSPGVSPSSRRAFAPTPWPWPATALVGLGGLLAFAVAQAFFGRI